VIVKWLREGRATPEGARAKLDWTLERIQMHRAAELASPLHERALATLDAELAARR
jgi:hypothetical protein